MKLSGRRVISTAEFLLRQRTHRLLAVLLLFAIVVVLYQYDTRFDAVHEAACAEEGLWRAQRDAVPWSEYAILVGLGIVPALLGRRITLPWMISALSVYLAAESADLYNSIISHWKDIGCDDRYLNGMSLSVFYHALPRCVQCGGRLRADPQPMPEKFALYLANLPRPTLLALQPELAVNTSLKLSMTDGKRS
jgi:hypothetical protein